MQFLDKLAGYKTHAFIVLGFGWAIAYIKVPALQEMVKKEDAASILFGLLALGGMSMRAGIQKAHDAIDASKVDVPK